MAKNDKMWEAKMSAAEHTFNGKMQSLKDTFMKQLDDAKKASEKKGTQNEASFQASLKTEQKKQETLMQMHEQEIKDIFEDEKTLNFIQQMRSFKKDWQANHSI